MQPFCRRYTSNVTCQKDIPMLRGSTASGLVIYEDGRFAYSNHSTDPACGKLCNAFDLVRIHKYGIQDEDAAPGTPTTKLPSYKAMMELVQRDKGDNPDSRQGTCGAGQGGLR